MGLFSDPRRDFVFLKTVRFVAAIGYEIATLNLVADPEEPGETLVIFLKAGGPQNRYHIVSEDHLSEILAYIETSVDGIASDAKKEKFRRRIGEFLLAVIRGFFRKYRLIEHSKIELHDAGFRGFGEMLTASDRDDVNRSFYIVYSADESTSLDRMSKSELTDSLRDLRQLYESYVTRAD